MAMHQTLQQQILALSARVDHSSGAFQGCHQCPPPAEQNHDPFEMCVMRPHSASSPMDLRVPPPSLAQPLQPLENISPPPASHLASALASLEDLQPPDPFEGSALLGFGLPAVGSALAARPAGELPLEKEVLLWTLVCTGGSDKPKKVPKDRIEQLSRQDKGVFAPLRGRLLFPCLRGLLMRTRH